MMCDFFIPYKTQTAQFYFVFHHKESCDKAVVTNTKSVSSKCYFDAQATIEVCSISRWIKDSLVVVNVASTG